MGCGASVPVAVDRQSSNAEDSSVTEWKIKMSTREAREAFEKEGTLSAGSPAGQLELRALLSDSIAQPIIANFAKRHSGLDSFMCWVDIQEFKGIETESYRYSKALYIVQKYVKHGMLSVLCMLYIRISKGILHFRIYI